MEKNKIILFGSIGIFAFVFIIVGLGKIIPWSANIIPEQNIAAILPAVSPTTITQIALPDEAIIAESFNNDLNQINQQILSINRDLTSVTKGSTAYNNLISTKNQKTIELVAKAQNRKSIMLRLAEKDPRAFLRLRIPSLTRLAYPTAAQVYVETDVTLQGVIDVTHVDDFQNHANSKFLYTLDVSGKKYPLYPTKPIYSPSGAVYEIKGVRLDSVVVATANTQSARVVRDAPPSEAVGEQRTLVFLVDYLNSGPRPFTVAEAKNFVFNGQFNNFYKEQSYNQTWFAGDVYGWIQLQKNYDSSNTLCYGSEFLNLNQTEIKNFILQNRIDLSQYSRVVYVIHPLAGGCAGIGKTYVSFNDVRYRLSEAKVGTYGYGYGPQSDQPFNWTYFDYVLSHEIGHNLGVYHANGWDCGANVIDGDCRGIEYGNYFDTMGYGQSALHFNALFKELLGWISPSQSLTITQSGRYTINPLELASSQKKFAKIKMQGSTLTFYLEYRQPVGFDAKLNDSNLVPSLIPNTSGLLVNYKNDIVPNLLDMSPTTQSWSVDSRQASLNLSSVNSAPVFEDSNRGITIGPVVAVSPNSITFDAVVKTPGCVRNAPTIQSANVGSTWSPGTQKIISFGIVNSDYIGCAGSNFRVDPKLPPGWQVGYSQPIFINPSQDDEITTSYIIPSTAQGRYELEVGVVNLSSGLKTTYQFSIEVIRPPRIFRLEPTSGAVGTQVRIIGENFYTLPRKNIVMLTGQPGGGQPSPLIDNISTLDPNSLTFTIPQGGLFSGQQISLPDGMYNVAVHTATLSREIIQFQVDNRSASVIGTPILRMVYKPTINISLLEARFQVSIKAGSQSTLLPKNNAFFIQVVNANRTINNWGVISNRPAGVTENGNYYVLPANSQAIFEVSAVYSPQSMPAGDYYAKLAQVYYGTNFSVLTVPTNQTNTVTVGGAQAPNIISITSPNQTPNINSTITIQGQGFHPTNNTISLKGQGSFNRPSANNGTVITFVPSLYGVGAGSYDLSVTHPTAGRSNIITFTISGTKSADFNNDDQISIADYLALLTQFGKRTGDAGFDTKYDLNNSNVIDSADVVLFEFARNNTSSLIAPATQAAISTPTYTLNITYPSAGSILRRGYTYNFRSTSPTDLRNVVFQIKNATTGQVVKTINASIVAANSSFSWKIPSTYPDGEYMLTGTTNGTPILITNGRFKVQGVTSITEEKSRIAAALEAFEILLGEFLLNIIR